MPPCLICAYVMEHYVFAQFSFGQRTLLVCLLLMTHTRLNAARWGFMVRLVDAFCYIKAALQFARFSENRMTFCEMVPLRWLLFAN